MFVDSMEAPGERFHPVRGEMYIDRQHTAGPFSPRRGAMFIDPSHTARLFFTPSGVRCI